MWTWVFAKNKKKFGQVTHVVYGLKGMLQVDHVIKPVLRSIFLFSTYKN